MTTFPDYPFNGESFTEELPDMYVTWTYDNTVSSQWTQKRVMKENVVFTDQVIDRQGSTTQAQINLASAATASATQQNVDEIQGAKSKGTWQFHGGPIPEDLVPAVNQFWLSDKEDQRTQEFCEAVTIRIHALGNQNKQTRDRVVLGSAEVGDKLIIQDLADRDGCSYTITSVEEHEPVDGDYTKAYALYGVEPDPTYCIGSVSPAEIVAIKLKSGSFEGGGDFLPLSGGTITGELTVDGNVVIDGPSGTALNVKKGSIDKVKIEHGGRIFCAYDLGLDTDDRTVTTKGWVKEQIAAIPAPEGGLSHEEKMYLQGFYPWRFGEGSQVDNAGDWLAKTSDYNVVLDPASWKILYFSTTDAYGQDLAGKFLNHMDMNTLRVMQLWFAREDGSKICSYTGKMRCRDQNFEQRFTVDMDASDKELVVSPHYDTASLEISKGEVIWIKCSAWG